MGSEDLFHKRKAKNKSALARKKSNRAAYDKVLIVCEGSKTEPYYFEDARNYHKLNTLNIRVEGVGKDPFSLIKRARVLYQEAEQAGDPYDRVYCVFDKDQHATYQQALAEISKAKPSKTWFAVASVPCFEYWLLLHFIYTTSPFYPTQGLSASQAVEKELRNYVPHYKKGTKALYGELAGQLDTAINYSKRADAEASRNATDNPSTKMHELIEYIQNIKSKASITDD